MGPTRIDVKRIRRGRPLRKPGTRVVYINKEISSCRSEASSFSFKAILLSAGSSQPEEAGLGKPAQAKPLYSGPGAQCVSNLFFILVGGGWLQRHPSMVHRIKQYDSRGG